MSPASTPSAVANLGTSHALINLLPLIMSLSS
nr:MAG TPA: hypothetical protein [Caudoviricetes sp.]